MPDWTKPMVQSFDYMLVNPDTWNDVERIESILSATITKDLNASTLGSAVFNSTEMLTEKYIRVYLKATQDEKTERICLGTFITQTSEMTFNGKYKCYSADGYTPLIELTEKMPEIGYTIVAGSNVCDYINAILDKQMKAPFVKMTDTIGISKHYTAETEDTWMTYLEGLLSQIGYSLRLNPTGVVEIVPNTVSSSMTPVFTYSADSDSIIQSDVTIEENVYGVPNVVEIIRSSGDDYKMSRVVNDSSGSSVSTVNRGRQIMYREVNPDTDMLLDDYANYVLGEKSKVDCVINYTHGYCGTDIGDCVMIDYAESGLHKVDAIVQTQTIECGTGCQVTEQAVATVDLRKGG